MVRNVLPDANIWASATLHSWFGLIAAVSPGVWKFHWTEDILAEAVHARRRRFPHASSTQMEQLRERLMTVMGDNQIRDFPFDGSAALPDPLDAHVHSAAVHGDIDVLVTQNVADFQVAERLPYDVVTADRWLIGATYTAPRVVDRTISQQLEFRRRIGEPFDLAAQLRAADCPGFAEIVHTRLDLM